MIKIPSRLRRVLRSKPKNARVSLTIKLVQRPAHKLGTGDNPSPSEHARCIFLCESDRLKPPTNLSPEIICYETIYVDNGTRSVHGQVIHVSGTISALREYFRSTGPAWVSNNPLAGNWNLATVN